MTQLSLFDSASDLGTLTIPVVPAKPVESPSLSASLPRFEVSVATGRSLPATAENEREIHHIGDLAAVILRRYDLVTQRRAMLQQRGAREVHRF